MAQRQFGTLASSVLCQHGLFRVVSQRDEIRIILRLTFDPQELIIPALASGISPADGRTRGVDRATAFFGIKELANTAEMLVLLTPHGIFDTIPLDCEPCLCLLETERKMLRQALNIALG